MIYFEYSGNLGNWLFEYANAISFGGGVVTGWLRDACIRYKLKDYQDVFGRVPFVEDLPNGVVIYKEPRYAFTPHPIFEKKDVAFKGYFQSEKYFDKQLVRSTLRPSAAHVEYLYNKYGSWLRANECVGVSVRRGDYMWKAQYHPFVGTRYLKKAIEMFCSSGSHEYVVCSDDIAWCKKFFTQDRFRECRFLFVEGESVLNQLYIHTLCKNNIISNSSFSWWGAWLNENPTKKVIAPSMWYGFCFQKKGMNWQDIYAEGWTVLQNKYTLPRWLWGHLTWFWEQFKIRAYAVKKSILTIY